jgi:putative methyltransferase (TIGR01177 family)
LKNKSLVLLSGEQTTLPEAEARALFLTYDPSAVFEKPEDRILLVDSQVDPFLVGTRVAFARRVGRLLDAPLDAQADVAGKKVRLRSFDLQDSPPFDPESVLHNVDSRVDMLHPDYEFTVVRGKRDYLALTRPGDMNQTWSRRRPRARPFFHPSAIFPKLSRALVNLSRCRQGEVFLDPFAGTGSLTLEAYLIGAKVVAVDLAPWTARGAIRNMKHFGQEWMGAVRADSFQPPLTRVDAVATDIPYGRTSSTKGKGGEDVLRLALSVLPSLLRSGSWAVLMHPRQLEIQSSKELALEGEHDLYVHKFLTRTISILRRR